VTRYGYDRWLKQKFCTRKCFSQKGELNSFYGRKHTDKTKDLIRIIHTGKPKINLRGENSHWWKGGVSQVNRTFRENVMRTLEYRNWRRNVFERDDYTCQECKQRGGVLNADHVKPFALYPKLRFELTNGRTLCVECHRKTDTYSRKRLVGMA